MRGEWGLPAPLELPARTRRQLNFGPSGAKPGHVPSTVTPQFPSQQSGGAGLQPPLSVCSPGAVPPPQLSPGLPQVGPAAAQLGPELMAG